MSIQEERYITFFTASILKFQKLLAPNKYKDLILNSLRFLVREGKIEVYAFVIMPNHIHLIWYIKPAYDYSKVQASFLKYTAQQMKFDLQKHHPKVLPYFKINHTDRIYQFWQRNALSIPIYSRKVFIQKMEYIHHNPTQEHWQLAKTPEAYLYSTAAFYMFDNQEWDFVKHCTEVW